MKTGLIIVKGNIIIGILAFSILAWLPMWEWTGATIKGGASLAKFNGIFSAPPSMMYFLDAFEGFNTGKVFAAGLSEGGSGVFEYPIVKLPAGSFTKRGNSNPSTFCMYCKQKNNVINATTFIYGANAKAIAINRVNKMLGSIS